MLSLNEEESILNLYGEIGPAWWGLTDADMVKKELAAMKGKRVTVHLNTPGGSVDEGIAIYNALIRHSGGVDTVVDSLAASMGSYLLQAGETRTVYENSMVMIHDPWSVAIGNSTEMRKSAEVLDKYAARMIPEYAKRSGKTEEEILDIMSDESWFTGAEALAAGFADAIEVYAEAKSITPAVGSLHRLCSHMPDDLREIWEANKAARLNDQLLSVGINRKSMNREDALRRSKKMAEMCAWIK